MGESGQKGVSASTIAALAAGIAFGTGATASQVLAGQGFKLTHVAALEFITATVILGILVLVRYHKMPSQKQILLLMGLGILEVLASLTYFYACNLLTVGQAVVIQFQFVWMTVVIQNVIDRTRPGKWTVIAAVCVIGGTLFASGVVDDIIEAGESFFNMLGFTLALACAVFYSFFLYLNGKVALDTHPVTRSFFMVVSGAAAALLPASDLFSKDLSYVMSLVPGGTIMGLMVLVVPCICLTIAARNLPGGIVAILGSVELPAAMLTGALILGEALTPLTVLGIVIIILSVIISETDGFIDAKRRADAKKPTK